MTIDPELKKEFKRIRKNQRQINLLFLFVIILLGICVLVHSASAQTITMSNPGGQSQRDIAVYYPNGTMQGFYNSTSVIPLDANESYIFALKPIGANPMDDFSEWINDLMTWARTNATAVIIMIILLGVGIKLARH